MTSLVRLVLAVALVAAAPPAAPRWDWSTADLSFVGGPGGYGKSRAICARVITAEPPAADRPTDAEAKALRGCDSEALYYGIGRPADPVAARKCALAENDAEAGMFGGRRLLMTIYANGRGAGRNIPVATHLACGIEEAAPAETSGRVSSLQTLRPGAGFGICDDATSGYLGGFCAAHEARVAKARRDARLAQIARAGGFANAADWRALGAALSAYADAHGSAETDMTGTLRGAMSIGAQEQVRDHFLESLAALQAGKVAPASKARLAASDRALNDLWKRLMKDLTDTPAIGGEVTRSGMRGGGRAWIAYRDAMLAFARRHYPRASQAGLARLLTDQRIDELSE